MSYSDQAHLETISRLADIGYWEVDLESERVFCSDIVRAIHDIPPGTQPILSEFLDCFKPEQRDELQQVFHDCRQHGGMFDRIAEITSTEGDKKKVHIIGEAVTDSHGRIASLRGSLQAVNRYLPEQVDLEHEWQFQQALLESLSEGIVVCNADGILSLFNRVTRELHGLPEQPLPPDQWAQHYNLYRPDGKTLMTTDEVPLYRALKGEEFENVEMVIRPSDDTPRRVWCRGRQITAPAGDVLGAVVAMRDVTEQRHSESQLQLLETSIARLNDIVLITEAEPLDNPGPRIVYVNDAFVRRTGYTREEAVGKSPRILQGPATQREELDRIRRALEQEQPIRAELLNYTKAGETFWLELDIAPVVGQSGCCTHWVSVERDITERKQTENHLAYVNRSLLLISACNESLIRATEEQQLLDEICRMAVDVGEYRMAWVGYAEQDEQQTIRPVAVAGEAQDYLSSVQISWSEETANGQGPAGVAMRTGTPAASNDTQADPRFEPWRLQARQYGMQSALCLPLRDQGETFGIFCLYSAEAQYFNTDEINLLQELADNLAFGIAGLRTEEERQKLHATLVKVAASVSGISESGFFEQLARNMTEVTNADIGCIARLDSNDHEQLQILAHISNGEVQENFSCPVQQSSCRELLEHREYSIITNVASQYPQDHLLAETDMQAFAGHRLENSEGHVIGFIYVICRQASRQPEFVHSALRIFAARAAAELERQATDQRIREQAELLNKAHEAIIVQDADHVIRYWNEGAQRLYGWSADEVIGQSLMELLHEDAEILKTANHAVLREGEWRGELQQQRRDGSKLVVEAHWSLVATPGESDYSILAINTDITERKAAEKQVQQLAYYDGLTQLPNRSLLMQRLQHALMVSERSGRSGAVLFIDLDNFKILNDTLGHAIGDQLLRQVAERIHRTVRNSDTVARLGGDEFVVLLENLDGDVNEAALQAETVANKIIANLGHTYQLDQYEYFSTPSIGITLFNGIDDGVEELLKRADIAMYQAKTAGRNTLRFFDPEMQSLVTARVALENDLRKALDNDQFRLHYQPQVTNEGRVIGAEALIRWRHPERGDVPPFDFIPLAEETGQIQHIGAWVLKTACETLARWSQDPVLRDYMLCVNVSVQQFRHPEFVPQVKAALEETAIRPALLGIEITESLFLDNVQDTIAKMVELQNLGVCFSLDDFGTGYSSLNYLKRLPLNQLKIDCSFVRDILADDNDAVIAKTIINLAHSLGLLVVAEGVETEAQRRFLGTNGCDAYQGYLFSPALPLEQFETWSREMVKRSLQG